MSLEGVPIESKPESFRNQDKTLTEIESLWDIVQNPSIEDTEMWRELCSDIRESAGRYTRSRFKHEETRKQGFGDTPRDTIISYDQSRRSAHQAFIINCHALARLARSNNIDDHWLRWGRSWLDILGGDPDRDDPDGREEFADQSIKIVAQTIREEEEKKYASGQQSLAG